MTLDVVVWALRVAAGLSVAWLAASVIRDLRVLRPSQFAARPTTSQGLAGTYTPPVTVVVAGREGLGSWIESIDYPRHRLQVVVAVPPGGGRSTGRAKLKSTPQVVTASGPRPGQLLDAGLRAVHGEVVVVVGPGWCAGGSVVARLVAALVDPFVGASVSRVTVADDGRPGTRTLEADMLARSLVQLGRHTLGAPVGCAGEPFAARVATLPGTWDRSSPVPATDLVSRVYAKGLSVAYVAEAVVAAPPSGGTASAAERIAAARLARRGLAGELRRSKVLDGPEKTDLRWALRSPAFAPVLMSGWLAVLALQVLDESWLAPLPGLALLAATFATPVSFVGLALVGSAAVQARRRELLALVPWLPVLMLGGVWAGVAGWLRSVVERPR